MSYSPGQEPSPPSRRLLSPRRRGGGDWGAQAPGELGSSSSRRGDEQLPRGAFRAGLTTRWLIQAVDTHRQQGGADGDPAHLPEHPRGEAQHGFHIMGEPLDPCQRREPSRPRSPNGGREYGAMDTTPSVPHPSLAGSHAGASAPKPPAFTRVRKVQYPPGCLQGVLHNGGGSLP